MSVCECVCVGGGGGGDPRARGVAQGTKYMKPAMVFPNMIM